MIFKRFFSSHHKSNSPQKRIDSIAKLEPSVPQDKQALHELAFNDEDKHVSLAALARLSSFALWQKMSQIARDPYVKREAQRFVEDAVLGQNTYELSENERIAYLLESANNDLRIQYLSLGRQQLSDEITLELLEKINNSSFTQRFINSNANSSLQESWLKSAKDKKLLQKLKNKVSDDKFAELISQRLLELKLAEEKPQQLSKQAVFIMSKLQALTERNDYGEIVQQSRLLREEYTELSKEFSCLPEEKKVEIEEKFSRIIAKIEAVLARLEPEWQRKQFKLEQQSRISNLTQLAKELKEQTDDLLTVDDSKLDNSVKGVEKQRDHIYQEVQQAEAFNADFPQQEFVAVADRTTDIVANLKIIREKVNKAWKVLDESEKLLECDDTDLDVKRDKQKSLKESWADLSHALPFIPKDLTEKWRANSKRWKKLFDEDASRQTELAKTCRQQLNAVEALINKGKFNPAIAKFSKLETNISKLSSKKSASLLNKFEKVRESVQRLEGWKKYLATPRRPELIEQAKVLASEKVDSVKERAEKVKYLRKQWQSLGALPSDSEQAVLFDDLIEQAFLPCRKFYEEQEKLREKAKKNRQLIIEEANNIDLKKDRELLANQYEKLWSRWNKEDRVDADSWRKLKHEWNEVISPIATKVNEWYLENQRRKQKLIDEVKTQVNEEDAHSAAEFAKQAQQQWKTLGYAGKKEENKLWRSFRDANDEVFARLKTTERQEKNQYNQEKERLISEIKALQNALVVDYKTSHHKEIVDLESRITDSELSKDRAVRNALSELIEINKRHEKRQQHIAKQQQYDAILSAISVFQSSSADAQTFPDEIWKKLDKKHQNWFLNVSHISGNRAYLTTKLEWITGIESPDYAEEQRKQINFEQLAEKMEQNYVADFESVLGEWVGCGPLSDDENALFERLSRCVHKQIADLDKTAL